MPTSKTASLLKVLAMYASDTNGRATAALWNALREAVDTIEHLEHESSAHETTPPQFTPEQLRFIRNEMNASVSCGAVDPLFQSVYDRAKEILRSPVEPE